MAHRTGLGLRPPIVGHLNKAVDNVRRFEVKKLKAAGEPAYLKKYRWIFLKKKNRLWGKPRARLGNLLDLKFRTVKAYLFKEDFDHLWPYKSVTWANKFMNEWTKDVMLHRSLPELKKFAKMIRNHQKLIPNYFRAFKAGVKGHVFKVDEVPDLIDAANKVQLGRIFISNNIPATIAYQLLSGGRGEYGLSSLSRREYEIAKLLSQCMTPNEIGETLYISPRTVRVHRTNMMFKLNHTRANKLLVFLR